MKPHFSLMTAGMLAGGLASAMAQSTTLPAKDQQGLNERLQIFVKAFNAKDVPAILALYTDDAVAVTPSGVFEGHGLRPWIEGQIAAGGHDLSVTVKNVQVHGAEVWRYGDWAALYGNQPMHGYWADIAVRAGDGWKIARSTTNIAMEAMPRPALGETASK